jgi:NAD(P)-dependent dehydrogenase (short-subunit alcohol dehydrogenase family)
VNILIIGGRTGLGNEFVRHCQALQRHFTIVSSQVDGEFAEHTLRCNLAKPEEVKRSIEQLLELRGKFDAIVFFQRSRHHSEVDEWLEEYAVSVSATRTYLQKANCLLKEDGPRSIIAIGSSVTRFLTSSANDSYQVSKSAQLQLLKYYARILGPDKIRINCVSPFTFIKPENQDFYLNNEKWEAIVKNRIPLRRSCTAKDIIGAIEFFIGENSQMVTGHELIVDGGLSLSLGVDL